jgi:hypothetical protein
MARLQEPAAPVAADRARPAVACNHTARPQAVQDPPSRRSHTDRKPAADRRPMAHRWPADYKEQLDKDRQPRALATNRTERQHTGSPVPRTEPALTTARRESTSAPVAPVLETRRVAPLLVLPATTVSMRRQWLITARGAAMTDAKGDGWFALSRRLGARNRMTAVFGRVHWHTSGCTESTCCPYHVGRRDRVAARSTGATNYLPTASNCVNRLM